MRSHAIFLVPLALLCLSACTPAGGSGSASTSPVAAPAAKTYPAIGEVQGFQSNGKVIVLHHQAIPGLMEEMTMPYELSDPALGAGLKVGDAVAFTITAQADDYTVTAIRKR